MMTMMTTSMNIITTIIMITTTMTMTTMSMNIITTIIMITTTMTMMTTNMSITTTIITITITTTDMMLMRYSTKSEYIQATSTQEQRSRRSLTALMSAERCSEPRAS